MDQSEKTPANLPEEVPAAPGNETPGKAQKPKKEKKTKKADNLPSGKKKKKGGVGKVIRTILLILIVLALILALLIWKIPAVRNIAARYLPFLSVEKTDNGPDYLYHTVERHDIENVLTGTGTLQPNDSYTVTASVSGDILKADFEEMDEVAEDQVLFVIDSSDLEEDIADRQKDVADALEDYNDALADYDDLIITSDTTGMVRELYVEEGDRVNDGTRIAYVVDSDTMVLEIPFFAANTDLCRKGSKATVTFPSTGETLDGVVKSVGGVTSVNETGSTVRTVSIAVRNPGGITYGMRAYASFIATDGVEYSSSADGSFVYNEEKTLTATSSGEIDSLTIEEGSIVHKNDRVAVLSSEALDNQVKQLKKSYDNLVDQLENLLDKREDYVITAPIAGTVVQKNYKELDTLGSNSMSSTTALAIIYDMSRLSFQMSIDELDLSLIEVGQTVKITSDSITDETFTGVITKKSIIGNSMSGTTTYPITVELDGNDRLLPGMNVNAEIVTSRAENVLAIPVSALKRGNTVQILKRTGDNGSVTEKPDAAMTGGFPDGKRSEQADAKRQPTEDGAMTGGFPGGKRGEQSNTENRSAEATAFETVNVTTGISDDDYIEITSGLEEGDVVVYEDPTTYSTRTIDSMFSMFSSGSSGGMRGMSGTGGSASGGMPSGSPGGMSGGMSGGMPGGMR